ncbi:E3 ubiquitin-protein ligase BRE1-like [Dendronephthya gigantea]|uniref:E3 ubiquitin-protein ligase BRE1-like n=1 Tax=Dendronephthya gigantea TaxID=151771 RepID=UPI00106BC2CD|nr:E3 ubiquitin-protein ligase BRE1-like [Dendronephthya gigantea]
MNSFSRFPPYVIAAAVVFMITFYHIFNLRSKNYNLERGSTILKEALKVSKEKNKVLVKDALEKLEKKDIRIKQLEEENYLKHTKLGEKQTKLAEMRSELEGKNTDIKKLHKLADEHKSEIIALSESVSNSKDTLTKLSVKADHLMVDHKKLKKENTKLTEENEKLQDDLEKEQSKRASLDDDSKRLKKENNILRTKVGDLTRKNEVIQESIKQKIKESYAARRVMTHQPHGQETEEQPTHKVSEDLTHLRNKFRHRTDSKRPKVAKKSHKDSEQPTTSSSLDQEITTSALDKNQSASEIMPNRNVSRVLVENLNDRNISKVKKYSDSVTVARVMVDNAENLNKTDSASEIMRNGNVSRVLVESSNDRNISKVENYSHNVTVARGMVDNAENLNKTDTISTRKSSFIGKSRDGSNIDLTNEHFAQNKPIENVQQGANEEENFEDGGKNRQIRSEEKEGETNADRDGVLENENPKRESPNTDKEEKFEGQTEGEDMNKGKEGRLEESRVKDEMIEGKREIEKMKRENEGGVKEGNSDMGNGRYALPVFPEIDDKLTMNIKTLQSPKVYGEHLDDDTKQNTVITTSKTDS